MTKAQYESLQLGKLKELAKARGMKRISTLKKQELIQRMLEEDEKEEKKADSGAQPTTETLQSPQETQTVPNTQEAKPSARKESLNTSQDSPKTQSHSPHAPRVSHATPNSHNLHPSPNQNTQQNSHDSQNDRTTQNPHQRPVNDGEEHSKKDFERLDSGEEVGGILEVMSDGYGFIRSDNFLPGENGVYVAPSQIRRFHLRTGDILRGNTRIKSLNEKFSALLYVKSINDLPPAMSIRRMNFEDMTPIFPNKRIYLERPDGTMAMRIVDLVSPIGKGQRGMIVSPPKAGKTTLLKDAAKSILKNNPEMNLMIVLIDERPEEVTDIKEAISGPNVDVIASTFDELPDHHRRVSEMAIERAKRLVESKKDVVIFIDSITRLARAYNQTVPPSGRTLSGGLDPAALHMPKRFFGAARNMREGGSLTILATALVDTGSKMDDVVYEEFKGTGNMELVLDRKLQEKRVFPAIDVVKSGTRREDLLLSSAEQDAVNIIRKALNGMKSDEAAENLMNIFARTRTNEEVVARIRRKRII